MTTPSNSIRFSFFCYKLLFCSIFLFFTNTALAQRPSVYLQIKKGIAYSHTGSKLNFKSVEATATSFIFKLKKGKTLIVDIDQVAQIDELVGNKAATYAIASSLGSFVLLSLAFIEDDSAYEGFLPFIAVFSFIVGGAGALLGLLDKNYDTVYQVPSFGKNNSPFQLDMTAPNQIPSLTFSYTF